MAEISSSSARGSREPSNLRSFPTRRSSDLIDGFFGTLDDGQWGQLRQEPRRTADGGELFYVTVVLDVLADETRSEEHTSELQSLAYLVCRLLFAKKKPPEAVIHSSAAVPPL